MRGVGPFGMELEAWEFLPEIPAEPVRPSAPKINNIPSATEEVNECIMKRGFPLKSPKVYQIRAAHYAFIAYS